MSSRTRIEDDQDGRGRGLVAVWPFKKDNAVVPYLARTVTMADRRRMAQKAPGQQQPTSYDVASEKTEGVIYAGEVRLKADGQVDEENACLINDVCPAAILATRHQWRTVDQVAAWVRVYNRETNEHVEHNNVEIVERRRDHAKTSAKKNAYEMWAVAIRDIAPGQRLLTSYGWEYWLANVMLDAQAPPWARLAAVAYDMEQDHFPALGFLNGVYVCAVPLRYTTPQIHKDAVDWHYWAGIERDNDPALTAFGLTMEHMNRTADAPPGALDAVSDKWLSLFGRPCPFGPDVGYAGWRQALQQVVVTRTTTSSISPQEAARNAKRRQRQRAKKRKDNPTSSVKSVETQESKEAKQESK